MQNQTQNTQEAWARFWGLVIVVLIGVVITFVAFFNLPGLQDPATGRLPEAAGRALIFLPVILLVGSVLIALVTERSRNRR